MKTTLTLIEKTPEKNAQCESNSSAAGNTARGERQCRILPRRAVLDCQTYDAPKEGRLDAIRLDFNESTRPVDGTYPEGMPPNWVCGYPEYGVLIDRLAARFDLSAENFVLTNGSDEAIALISNTFIESGEDQAIVSNPCFFMIKQSLKLAGARLNEVSVKEDLEFDIDGIEEALQRSPKLAMFASPDNPTGSVIPVETIERWLGDYPEVLFVIDEAYGEFAGTTVIPLVSKYENLLVLKTFSKAWGMAGFRLGMVVGNSNLTEYLKRVKLPYSVNSAAVFTALRLLEREADVVVRVEETVKQLARIAAYLSDRGFAVRETSANWCLVRAGMQATDFTEFAGKQNVLVRNRSTSGFARFGVGGGTLSSTFEPMWGLVRVSAGTDDELSKFEEVVDAYRSSYALIFDLDGTLVDTSKSFDQTVSYLVEKFSGKPFDLSELYSLRLEGGFNDDWVAARELLKRRGVDVAPGDIAREGEKYYFSIAGEREELLLSVSLLERLRRRHPLFIVTGRHRHEYDAVWADRLDALFERVYCVDDVPGLAAKPAPDYLTQVLSDFGIASGAYIGNSVDDMQAARAAGLTAIGIVDSDVPDVRSAMEEAGAQAILRTCAQMSALLMVEP